MWYFSHSIDQKSAIHQMEEVLLFSIQEAYLKYLDRLKLFGSDPTVLVVSISSPFAVLVTAL